MQHLAGSRGAVMSTINVRIPTILRTYTGGEAEVKASGSTVREVVADLDASYSGIASRILDEGGNIRRFVNVYVGEEDVRFADGLDTATPDGAQISIIPAVAGG
jgi:sulfur-carrier protein